MSKNSNIAMIAVAAGGLYLLYTFGRGIGVGLANFFSNPLATLENGAWDLLTGGQWSQYQKELHIYNAKIAAQEEAQKNQKLALEETQKQIDQGNVPGAVAAYQASVQYRISALENSPGGLDPQGKQVVQEQAVQGAQRVTRDAQIAAKAWNTSKEQEYLQSEINAAMKDLEYYRQMYTAGRLKYDSWAQLNTALTAQIDNFKRSQQSAAQVVTNQDVQVAAAADPGIPGNSSPGAIIYPAAQPVVPAATYGGIWSFTGLESNQTVRILLNSCHPLENVGCEVYVTIEGGRGGSTNVHYQASQGSPHIYKNGADLGYCSVGKAVGINQGDLCEIRLVR